MLLKEKKNKWNDLLLKCQKDMKGSYDSIKIVNNKYLIKHNFVKYYFDTFKRN